MEPLISIGMPVHNCEGTVKSALRSITLQEYENWELILIDDGSTDGTIERAVRHGDDRIRIFSGKTRQGIARRLNQAVELSRGQYFARMDGDDIAYPERLKLQVEFLCRNKEIDLVGCRVVIFNGAGDTVGTYPFRQTHGEICRRPWSGFYLPHPTWLGRIEWFHANPYREDFKKTQDQELLLRTYKHSRFSCLPDFLLGYRKAALSLKTILAGRYLYSLALLRNAAAEKDFFLALGIVGHALKSLVEIFAVTTGLNYRILQHRAMPVPRAELNRWKEVWAACNRLDSTEEKDNCEADKQGV